MGGEPGNEAIRKWLKQLFQFREWHHAHMREVLVTRLTDLLKWEKEFGRVYLSAPATKEVSIHQTNTCGWPNRNPRWPMNHICRKCFVLKRKTGPGQVKILGCTSITLSIQSLTRHTCYAIIILVLVFAIYMYIGVAQGPEDWQPLDQCLRS